MARKEQKAPAIKTWQLTAYGEAVMELRMASRSAAERLEKASAEDEPLHPEMCALLAQGIRQAFSRWEDESDA